MRTSLLSLLHVVPPSPSFLRFPHPAADIKNCGSPPQPPFLSLPHNIDCLRPDPTLFSTLLSGGKKRQEGTSKYRKEQRVRGTGT